MKGSVQDLLRRQYSFRAIFFGVVLIVVFRVLAEYAFLLSPLTGPGAAGDGVRFFLENVYYFLVLFLVATVFIAWISRTPLIQVMNYALKVYPVIILPPLVDRFVFGQHEGYAYATAENFGWNFLTLSFVRGDASFGISLEILIGLLAVSFYVYDKTGNFWKGLATFLFIDLYLVVLSTPEIVFGGYADFHFGPFLPLYYFFPFLVLLGALVYRYDKRKFSGGLRNLRVERAMVFVVLALLGAQIPAPGGLSVNTWNVFLVCAALFLVWEASVMVNDVADLEIDRVTNTARPLVRGIIRPSEYRLAAVILSFVALSCAAMINFAVFVLMAVAVALAYAYSREPVRLRKTLWGNVVIGLSVLISFWAGLFAATPRVIVDGRLAFVSGLIFLLGSVVSLAKDVKDVAGDGAAGVKNLFVLYGVRRARAYLSAVIFIVLNIPAILFLDPVLFLANSGAVCLYYRFSSIVLLYCVTTLNVAVTFWRLYQL